MLGVCLEGLPGLPGRLRHSPLADGLAALEVGRQVAHSVHSLHQLSKVRLDLQTRGPMRPCSPGVRPCPCPCPML